MAWQYIAAGCDVIAVVDPMTSQIDPGLFETFVVPHATGLFKDIRDLGALSSFFVCGNATQNIELMCKCKPDNISIDENISLEKVKEIALAHGISFGGNMRLTTVLLLGTGEDAMADALSCMDIGGKNGFVLAPGCDLPMKTPGENLKAVTRLVHDDALQGEVRASGFAAGEVEKLDLNGHWLKDKLVIDVITLDSLSCAPCQYMVDALKRATKNYPGKVVIEEHKIKDKKGVQMMASLGVQHIPTIVMDGKVEFSSRTPSVEALQEKIESYLEKKTIKA
jgi:uroporphyrinogen decarboxylase